MSAFNLCCINAQPGDQEWLDPGKTGQETAHSNNIAGSSISHIEPTPLFPKTDPGEPLMQIARLSVNHTGNEAYLDVRITLAGKKTRTETLGIVKQGLNKMDILIPDIDEPSRLRVELIGSGGSKVLDSKTVDWQPQKKWKLFFVQYSHHDLGFLTYYQLIRRNVREKGLESALELCRLTDEWDEEDRFRWTVETSELFPGFLDVYNDHEVDELVSRIHEGRIDPAAFHNTSSTDFLDFETMARLFYTPNRYTRDLLGIGRSNTGMMSDAVAITWPFTTYAKEADLPYIWHGPNWDATCLIPARDEPVFYWQPPDGDDRKPLVRSFFYWKDNIRPKLADTVYAEMVKESLCEIIQRYGEQENWLYDALLVQEAEDFSTPDIKYSEQLRDWNERYSHPIMINATMSMFMEYMDSHSREHSLKVKTFHKDAPNAWADQEVSDAKLLARARQLGSVLPTAEKFSAISMALSGNGYPWTDLWQAYDRLLMYHEHTNGALGGKDACYYETEKVMHRTLVREGQEFADSALEQAMNGIEKLIPTKGDADVRTLAVFNPLCHNRSDIVHINTDQFPAHFILIDNTTGNPVATQELTSGETVFFAENVPSLGYKTYTVRAMPGSTDSPENTSEVLALDEILENIYYKISFDNETGGITSIIDKELNRELVDSNSRWKFNEYLYEKGIDRERVVWQNDKSATLKGSSGAVQGSMIAEIEASGVESIRQEVILYANIKRIDIINSMDKSSSGFRLDQYISGWDYAPMNQENREAVFYAFPIWVEDFKIQHQLTGAVIEPIIQQFEGSSTSYYTIRHFTDLSNENYGITIASVDAPLVEYGRPRHAPWYDAHRLRNDGANFESVLKQPENSHVYFYMMNNFFSTNVCIDQPGPKTFRWSIRSHLRGWKESRAYEFGRDASIPLISRMLDRGQQGSLPDKSFSFVRIDKPNILCSTIKKAEVNGEGFILRFNELAGEETTVTVSLDFLDKITGAIETNLVEDDRPGSILISDKRNITFDLRPNGVKTIRVLAETGGAPPRPENLMASPTGDMEVELQWEMDPGIKNSISHYDIYRMPQADVKPGLRYFAGSSTDNRFTDRPKLNFGGWLNNRIRPESTYYYTVRAVDRLNNVGAAADRVKTSTLNQDQMNLVPLQVKGLYIVQVSPSSPDNYINLWFYTNCEPDIHSYEIHRSTQMGFDPGISTRIATLGLDEENRLLNRQMYADRGVKRQTTYYYRICAIDNAGQKGMFSAEAEIMTQ